MLRLATDAGYRDQLRAGGAEHASQFTWERAATATWSIYERSR